ncbi:hypothetical protein HY030_02065 [Candidatus Gottesmanbacteria bacterium]|nr:hypothetical protein [Candidatus Gottesmanbacteria bacterium]
MILNPFSLALNIGIEFGRFTAHIIAQTIVSVIHKVGILNSPEQVISINNYISQTIDWLMLVMIRWSNLTQIFDPIIDGIISMSKIYNIPADPYEIVKIMYPIILEDVTTNIFFQYNIASLLFSLLPPYPSYFYQLKNAVVKKFNSTYLSFVAKSPLLSRAVSVTADINNFLLSYPILGPMSPAFTTTITTLTTSLAGIFLHPGATQGFATLPLLAGIIQSDHTNTPLERDAGMEAKPNSSATTVQSVSDKAITPTPPLSPTPTPESASKDKTVPLLNKVMAGIISFMASSILSKAVVIKLEPIICQSFSGEQNFLQKIFCQNIDLSQKPLPLLYPLPQEIITTLNNDYPNGCEPGKVNFSYGPVQDLLKQYFYTCKDDRNWVPWQCWPKDIQFKKASGLPLRCSDDFQWEYLGSRYIIEQSLAAYKEADEYRKKLSDKWHINFENPNEDIAFTSQGYLTKLMLSSADELLQGFPDDLRKNLSPSLKIIGGFTVNTNEMEEASILNLINGTTIDQNLIYLRIHPYLIHNLETSSDKRFSGFILHELMHALDYNGKANWDKFLPALNNAGLETEFKNSELIFTPDTFVLLKNLDQKYNQDNQNASFCNFSCGERPVGEFFACMGCKYRFAPQELKNDLPPIYDYYKENIFFNQEYLSPTPTPEN